MWQVDGQTSTHYELSPRAVPYTGQAELISNMKVCTAYKVCATATQIIAMEFNQASTFDQIRDALLPPGAETATPQMLFAAQITTEGIKNKLQQSQYDALQESFRESVKRFDFTTMGPAEVASGLKATTQATASLSDLTDPAARNAEIGSILDTAGSGLDAFISNPSMDNADSMINLFSNILGATGGQEGAAGTARRLLTSTESSSFPTFSPGRNRHLQVGLCDDPDRHGHAPTSYSPVLARGPNYVSSFTVCCRVTCPEEQMWDVRVHTCM